MIKNWNSTSVEYSNPIQDISRAKMVKDFEQIQTRSKMMAAIKQTCKDKKTIVSVFQKNECMFFKELSTVLFANIDWDSVNDHHIWSMTQFSLILAKHENQTWLDTVNKWIHFKQLIIQKQRAHSGSSIERKKSKPSINNTDQNISMPWACCVVS